MYFYTSIHNNRYTNDCVADLSSVISQKTLYLTSLCIQQLVKCKMSMIRDGQGTGRNFRNFNSLLNVPCTQHGVYIYTCICI